MNSNTDPKLARAERGVSIIETLLVLVIISIAAAVAMPQLASIRRRQRMSSLPNELQAQLRLTRQEAMSQRQVMTLRYDNTTKQITVIDHQESNITFNPATNTMVTLPGSTAASADVNPDVVVRTISLLDSGITSSELVYGRPSAASTVALGDGTNFTALPTATNQYNITFQPDGSIVDANRNPINRAIYFYNTKYDLDSAFAISVLGAAGRVKVWRYNTNVSLYVE
jgi:prepilin-type N-terminal cleavage/methylation domain-containing protein